MAMKFTYNDACQKEFRRVFKIDFYAWCYSSWKGLKVWEDFKSMYMMGNEL